MSEFSPTEAAFSGFGFIRRHPVAVLIWAGVFLVYDIATVSAIIAFLPHKLEAVRAFQANAGQDEASVMELLPTVMLMVLLRAAAQLVILSVASAAAFRAELQPERKSLGYLRLGSDELHVGGLILLLAALALGHGFVVMFAMFTLALFATGLKGVLAFAYLTVLFVLAGGVFVYPFVRLSLAGPMTLIDGHVRLLESWKHTKRAAWRLFGAYALAFLFTFVLFLITLILVVVAGWLATGQPPSLKLLFARDTSSLPAFLAPVSIFAAILDAAGAAVSLAVVTSVASSAYKAFGPSADGRPAEA